MSKTSRSPTTAPTATCSCGRCLAFCWLGHATETVVTSGEAQPVCLPCITAINDQHSIRDKLKLFDRVHDPKRHDKADT